VFDGRPPTFRRLYGCLQILAGCVVLLSIRVRASLVAAGYPDRGMDHNNSCSSPCSAFNRWELKNECLLLLKSPQIAL
jgi:hypothetical protein